MRAHRYKLRIIAARRDTIVQYTLLS